MKYLAIRELEEVTSAMNFETPDCHVVGGCDLYTTKAAGSDKKLYKNIETTLESQHASLLRLSASLSPPIQESLADSLNLSRSSPFGPMSQISSRRTFAYLIATLNASHPDYDFSHILRPSDFRRERSLRSVMQTIDSTIHNLLPRPSTAYLTVPSNWASGPIPAGLRTPGGTPTWGPRMWRLIDEEMKLRECAFYCYSPEEDPFDGEDSSVWSLHYFFFNKTKKRVAYLYLRGLSVISHSPVRSMLPMTPKRRQSTRDSRDGLDTGAQKRARYWLGDRANADGFEGGWADDDDIIIEEPGDDEVDADDDYEVREYDPTRYISSDEDEDMDAVSDTEEDHMDVIRHKDKSAVRAMSESMADAMEV